MICTLQILCEQIRKNEVGRVCGTYGRRERCIPCFGKTRAERPFGRPSHKWEENIKIGLLEVCWGFTRDYLAQNDRWRAVVNVVMNFGR
jgi:hypothetical protein